MNNYWIILSLFSSTVIAIAIYLLIKERLLSFLINKNLTTSNYAGKQVINCAGLLVFLPVFLASLPFFVIQVSLTQLMFVLMIPVLTFTGLLDDILGDSSAKGLIGHADVILNGSFTTGSIKALLGGILGLLIAWIRFQSMLTMILDFFIFTLSVNTINLLDLRPGRAIKGFGSLLIITAAVSKFTQIQYILPTVIVLLMYTDGELKETYMLGDTGSNLLGGVLGFYGVIGLQAVFKWIMLAMLLSLHVLSEFVSISKIIEMTPWLDRLDMLGRGKKRSKL